MIKDLFMCLLLNIGKFGHIVEANMYKGVSSVKIEGNDKDYVVTIREIEKAGEKENA